MTDTSMTLEVNGSESESNMQSTRRQESSPDLNKSKSKEKTNKAKSILRRRSVFVRSLVNVSPDDGHESTGMSSFIPLLDELEKVQFKAGEVVLRQGDPVRITRCRDEEGA